MVDKISFTKEEELKEKLQQIFMDYWMETGKVITSVSVATGIDLENKDYSIEGYIEVEDDTDFIK
jgi:hypothetical protein